MKLSFFRLPEDMSKQAKNAYLTLLAFFASQFLIVGFLTFLIFQTPTIWRLWAMDGLGIGLFIVEIIALISVRRGRHELGIWIFNFTWLTVLFLIPFLYSGLGLLFLLIALVFTVLIGNLTLSPRSSRLLILSGILIGTATLLVDLYIPLQRDTFPGFQNVVYIALAIILPVLVYAVVQQFRNYSLSTKLLVSLVGVTLVSISVIGFISNYVSSTRINEQVGSNLAETASQLASTVGGAIDGHIKTLSTFALNQVVQNAVEVANTGDTPSQGILNLLNQRWKNAPDDDPLVSAVLKNNSADDLLELKAKFPVFLQISATDKYGALIASTGHTSNYYYANEEWWQAAWNNGKGQVYISQVTVDKKTNAAAFDIAIPITAHDGDSPIGVLWATIDANEFKTLIQSFKIGQTGRSDLLFQNNQTLTAETGLDTLSPEDVVNLAALPKTYGQITYEGSPALVSTRLISAPLSPAKDIIEQLGWKVLVHQDISEAQEGVTAAKRSIIIAAIILSIGIALVAVLLAQVLTGPIVRLTQTADKIAGGEINIQADVESTDEIGILAGAFNRMTAQLRNLIGTLESRVAERTHSLELAAEVGRSVSEVRALDVMLKDAAEIIRSRFGLYYTQVYLVNPSQNVLTLQSGTGTVGAELVGRSHRLPIDTASINGRAVIEKRSVVISDTTASPAFHPNPLLPETRSEMAIPLMVGEKVVGVLDLQSQQAGALNQDLLPAFEALAGQLAVAIQNASLLAEAEQARAEVEAQSRRLVRTGWNEYLDAIHKPEYTGFEFKSNQVTQLNDAGDFGDNGTTLSTPIAVSGEPIGVLAVELDAQSQTPQNSELVHIVARQVAQQIESLRLLESAERYRAEAEESSRRLIHEGWKNYAANANERLSYFYDLKEVLPYNEQSEQQEGAILPLKVRDETIGKLIVQGIKPSDSESLALANAVVERLGAHIESLRLTQQTEQALQTTREFGQREQSLRHITSAVRSSTDPATILRTAVRELGAIFGRKAVIRLTTNREAQANQAESVANKGPESVPPAELPNAAGGNE